jgi:hypothetical protein
MSSDVQEIEQAIRSLPRPEVEQLREWIENFLEDQCWALAVQAS